MSKMSFKPFENESDSLQIGEMTIENRLDRISIYGSLDIFKDKAGLEATKQLKAVVDQALKVLETSELPDQVLIEKPETVSNPFA